MATNVWFAVRLAWWKIWNRGDSMALVFVRRGSEYGVEFAHYECSVAKGEEYRIGKHVFYALSEWTPEYWQGVRLVGLMSGNIVGSVVLGHGEADVDRTLIEELVEGSLVRAAHSNFKESAGGLNMKWVMVGAVVLVVGYVVYKYVLGGHIPGMAGNSTVVVPSPTPGGPVWEPVSMLLQGVLNA